MPVRTFGIEEEFLLVDPATGQVVERSAEVLRGARDPAVEAEGDVVDLELLSHQVELRTEPCVEVRDAREQAMATRRVLGQAATEAGVALVASGTSPFSLDDVQVTSKDRYRDMMQEFGAIGWTAGTCGMHVHVGIECREEGVGVIDRLRPWLPLVLALSANSPFAEDRDSGYASWRAQVWTRWPTAGATEIFGDEATYDAVSRELFDAGAARDPGMLYFEARLAAAHPTIEIRVADVCTDPADTVVLAAVVRGLVTTAAREWDDGVAPAGWRTEVLRAAAWRASRYGLSGSLVHPQTRDVHPAWDVLGALIAHIRDALVEAGDLDVVTAGFELLLGGTGASRQRAAYERTGSLEGVVADLARRTEASWSVA